jgi:hypothetical protein
MLKVGSKFKLATSGVLPTIYTVKEVHEDDTVTATYKSFIGLGQYVERETAPIETQACIECI